MKFVGAVEDGARRMNSIWHRQGFVCELLRSRRIIVPQIMRQRRNLDIYTNPIHLFQERIEQRIEPRRYLRAQDLN
jgi:hypothetical protein